MKLGMRFGLLSGVVLGGGLLLLRQTSDNQCKMTFMQPDYVPACTTGHD